MKDMRKGSFLRKRRRGAVKCDVGTLVRASVRHRGEYSRRLELLIILGRGNEFTAIDDDAFSLIRPYDDDFVALGPCGKLHVILDNSDAYDIISAFTIE